MKGSRLSKKQELSEYKNTKYVRNIYLHDYSKLRLIRYIRYYQPENLEHTAEGKNEKFTLNGRQNDNRL